MQVRIGVVHSPREIEVELADGDADSVAGDVEKALDGKAGLLWLTDKRGRRVGVVADKITYVEVGSEAAERRVGFSAL
ncbi:MAG: DUF3107 domain-containing protein [Acidimicrobiales bacterium]